jgi:hypothetical protein
MKKVVILCTALIIAVSCREDVENKVERGTENAIEKGEQALDKGGEAVKKTANKAADEFNDLINRNMNCTLTLSDELKGKGISAGKFYIEEGANGKDNKVVVYLISEKDFNSDVKFKVVNKDGLELGRSTLKLNRKAGDAGYEDIVFDERTDIESRSTITVY